jgi:hypothetical protein
MNISRRTLLAGLAGSSLYWAVKPVGALSFAPPPPGKGIFIWLHGLMGIVVDSGSIRILSPAQTHLSHVHKFGRITPDADSTADLTGTCSIQMSGRPTSLPKRDPAFGDFVTNISTVDASQSAFALTLPYPNEIIPVRIVKPRVRSFRGGVLSGDQVLRIPLTIIFHYSDVDFSSVTTSGITLPQKLTLPNGDEVIHAHVFVEPDPTDTSIQDAQPDLDALMAMVNNGQDRIIIDPEIDSCPKNPPQRHCHKLTAITDQNGNDIPLPGATRNRDQQVSEQMSIFEWGQKCDQALDCLQPNTYDTGACPPHIFLAGTTWSALAPVALKLSTSKKSGTQKEAVTPKKH